MSEPTLMDKTYNFIINKFKKTGVAPHYTEIADALDLTMEEGRQTLHELVSIGIPGIWISPGTDYISSFAPFSNIPTQHRISVDGEHKWFGQ